MAVLAGPTAESEKQKPSECPPASLIENRKAINGPPISFATVSMTATNVNKAALCDTVIVDNATA